MKNPQSKKKNTKRPKTAKKKHNYQWKTLKVSKGDEKNT